jgi:hypothetical protein|nr:MAG TPA: hypothetical protein [Caudoviricetes sp.]
MITITASSSGGDYEVAPAGVFLARCYQMVDIGTHTFNFMGKDRDLRKVYLFWELLKDSNGQPVDGTPTVMGSYTLSMNKKSKLRPLLEQWRGKPFTDQEASQFNLTTLLDKYCTVQIVHTESGDRTYANVNTIMATQDKAPGVRPIVAFSVSDPDGAVLGELPEWLQKKIEASQEYQKMMAEGEAPQVEAVQAAAAQTNNNDVNLADLPF